MDKFMRNALVALIIFLILLVCANATLVVLLVTWKVDPDEKREIKIREELLNDNLMRVYFLSDSLKNKLHTFQQVCDSLSSDMHEFKKLVVERGLENATNNN